MKNETLRKSNSQIMARFALAIEDLMAKMRQPASEDEAELLEQLQRISLMGEGGPLTNPMTFYQVSRAMQGEELPTMKDLSESLHMPKATMTRTVDQWVKQGYAERVYDPNDRRIIRIALTDRGQQLRDIMIDFGERRISSIMNNLIVEEQVELIRLLSKLSES